MAARWRCAVSAAALLAMAAGPGSASAAEPADSDWPCIQRLVPELAASQMWAGALPASADESPSDDVELATLAHRLASRDMPVDQAQAAIEQFVDGLALEDRNAQLTRLFHDVLELINQERSEIIEGIKRYTRKQQHLADKIGRDSQQLKDVQPGTTPDAETQAVLNERQWDLRIFQDRQRMLRQICEQPVLMEQRAFALARVMQAQLVSQ